MFEKTSELAERLVSSMSRRGFMGQFTRLAAGTAFGDVLRDQSRKPICRGKVGDYGGHLRQGRCFN